MRHFNSYALPAITTALLASARADGTSASGLAADADPTHAPRNIVMVVVDDLNDFAGPLGGAADVLRDPELRARVSPNLDRLAALGATFTCAQTAHPACNASRAAVMTGISGETSGLTANDGGLNWRNYDPIRYAVTLPQHLKDCRGYTIKTSGKVWHNNHSDLPNDRRNETPPPDQRAVTSWDAAPSFQGQPPRRTFLRVSQQWPIGAEDRVGLQWSRLVPKTDGTVDRSPAALKRLTNSMADQRTANWAAEEIRSQPNSTTPTFVAVGVFHPHLPWEAPVHFFDRFPIDQISVPRVAADDLDDLSGLGRRMGIGSVHPHVVAATPGSDMAWRTAIQAYLASVAFADHAIGEILDAVESKNRDEDPTNDWAVVLWSDHGWHLGEKRVWHKFTVWEEAARSNLMIYAPTVTRPGQRIDTPVDLLAVAPTILDLAGAEPLPQLQGESLLPLIAGKKPVAGRVAFTSFGQTEKGRGFHAKKYAVRSDRFRFIHYQSGDQELYDCKNDPDGFYNLLHPSNSARLAKYDLTETTVDRARRWHGNRLLERLIGMHSEDVRRGEVSLKKILPLGALYIEDFAKVTPDDGFEDGAEANELDLRDSQALAPVGDRVVAVMGEPLLKLNQNFLFAADVVLGRDKESAEDIGLAFGPDPQHDGWEFLLTSRNAVEGNGHTDALLARVSGGKRTPLLRTSSIVPLGDPAHQPSNLASTGYRLVARYTSLDDRIDIRVLNSRGVCRYHASHVLDSPIPIGSRFALVSRNSRGGTAWNRAFLLVEQNASELEGLLTSASKNSTKTTQSHGGSRVEN